MPTKVHFIDVGQGNMTLLQLANGGNFLYDCNLTNDNAPEIIKYIGKQIGLKASIDVFICSHRDADHMRGIKTVHKYFPVQCVWDSGVVGTTPNSTEYKQYMDLRRQVGFKEVLSKTYYDYGNTRLRILSSKNSQLPHDANAQSVVIKVIHRNLLSNRDQSSVLLTGDTGAISWKHIQRSYTVSDLSCSILLASHHGSLTYFQDPSDQRLYTTHLRAKSPDITIISVGKNAHGHPHQDALKQYEQFSRGSSKGDKVFRTDQKGHMCATLQDDGRWMMAFG